MMLGYQHGLISSTIGTGIAWVAAGDTMTTVMASQSTESGRKDDLTENIQPDHLQMNSFAAPLSVRDVFRRSKRGLIDPGVCVHLKLLALNLNVQLEKDQPVRDPVPRLILIVQR